MIRDESVEQAVVPIFGEIDASAVRCHRDRLVMESPQSAKRPWLGESDLIGGGDLEAPAMVLRAGDVRLLRPLLAGDPALPRCRSARTVPSGSGKAQEVLFDGAGLLVVDDRGRSAEDRAIAAAGVEELRSIDQAEALEVRAEGAPPEIGVDPDLVVADEDRPARTAVEGRHAVVFVGDQQAVVHLLAPSRDGAIREPGREVEDAGGILDEVAVAAGRVREPEQVRRHRVPESHETTGRGGCHPKKGPAIDRSHALSIPAPRRRIKAKGAKITFVSPRGPGVGLDGVGAFMVRRPTADTPGSGRGRRAPCRRHRLRSRRPRAPAAARTPAVRRH